MTPDIYTNQELFLEVGDDHELYVHDWGNKHAKTPIIFLHGGPGSSCSDGHKQTFLPERERVIFFDQRGCGRSLPYGSLEHNTTAELIKDINKVADKLGLDKFIIYGGSWGSCLALAYTITHPEHVKAMVLRGIFTGSQREIDWLDQGHFKTFFPEVWERYLAATPKQHHADPTAYHYQRLLHGNEVEQKESGYAYANTEGAVLSLDDRLFKQPDYETFDPASTRILAHYLSNTCFLPDRHILKNAHTLDMPVYIVQGRYDVVCPPETAYELHTQLPNSELIWALDGHKAGREGWNLLRTITLELTK
jgi:proline iminopeptidase